MYAWIFFAYLLLSGLTPAQPKIAHSDLTPSIQQPQRKPLNSTDFAQFADVFFRRKMRKFHIPGAAVVCVKNGEILYQQGYGFADLGKKRPVDTHRTKFRVASVSKLFTATAVMQLAERGSISLHGDINDYLTAFSLHVPGPIPLTPAHLLTHTSGFDHQHIGRYARTASEVSSLGAYLERHRPRFVAPPGQSISYSNYGIALAGFLVEARSGLPFHEYIRQHIFEPLGMGHSQFTQPNPADEDLAVGYYFANGRHHAFDVSYPNLVPAGALISSAEDIAHFMIAHLEEGRYGNYPILQPETVNLMHERHASVHQELPGWCYGFYEDFRNGYRAILHSGDTKGFASLLYLIPELRTGFFIVYNTSETDLSNEFVQEFFDRYFPRRKGTNGFGSVRTATGDLQEYSGTYRLNLSPQYSLEKYADLMSRNTYVTVTQNEPGALVVTRPSHVLRIVPVGDHLFETADHAVQAAFEEDADGNIKYLHLTDDRPGTLTKIPHWQERAFHWFLEKMFRLLFAALGLIFLFQSVRKLMQPGADLAAWLTPLAFAALCFGNQLFLILFKQNFDVTQLRFGVSKRLVAILLLPLLIGLASLLTGVFVTARHKRFRFSLLEKVQLLSFYVTSVAFTAYLNYWNLIGFHF